MNKLNKLKTNANITIGMAWRMARDRFIKANIASASLDAQLLAEHVFSFNNVRLAINEHDLISPKQLLELEKLVKGRLSGKPIARILGKKEFYGLEFKLNNATLIPRPETEILVDLALKHIQTLKSPHILELGIGSGCISIAILTKNKNARAVGVDLSKLALKQANENANIHKVNNQIDLLNSNWFKQIKNQQKFDIIISNPPYIKTSDILLLAKEVKDFDPKLALDGGKDGLEPYRIIAKNAKQYLKPKALVIVEFGLGQEKAISKIFNNENFNSISLYRDLSGIVRAMVAKN